MSRIRDKILHEKIYGEIVTEAQGFHIGPPDWYDTAGELLILNPLPVYGEEVGQAISLLEKFAADNQFEFDIQWVENKYMVLIENIEHGYGSIHPRLSEAICAALMEAINGH